MTKNMRTRRDLWKASLWVFCIGAVVTGVLFALSQGVDHGIAALKVGDGFLYNGKVSMLPRPAFMLLLGIGISIVGGLIILLPYWLIVEARQRKE